MFYWDPHPEIFTIPYFNWPILWYGVFFTVGFIVAFFLFISILTRYFLHHSSQPRPLLRAKAVKIADQLTVYMVIATLVGARLGHFLFYEDPSTYWNHPWEIFQIWKGGLASHGAVIAIL